MAEDASSKKFLVSNFNNYKMVDSSIIDKLPPSWKDFKHTLKHNKDELSLVQLGSHFRIEETLRVEESGNRKGKEIVGSSSVNMIEDRIVVLKRKMVEILLVQDKDIRILIPHKDDAFARWIDSGATCHACKDRCWFETFHPVQDGSVLHMGDESTEPILGRRNVILEFSSGKTITLVNVVYVPGLRKNLMSSPVLNKCGYKQVYEYDKYILSRCGVFVGFGYYNNDMFMLNLNKVPNTFSSVCMISSIDVDSSMWHASLRHVHYKRMLAMSKDNLIPEFDITLEKCNTCMLTKITIQPFKDTKRDYNISELIHSILCDFHATPSLGNKKYVATFIDDASRFFYVYLCHAKDEALDKLKSIKLRLSYNKMI
ncbi:zinc finger, CCHC-type containing protein [Tanacetum coccineum]